MTIDRCLAIFGSTLLLSAGSCGEGSGPGKQTDAEIACRESGLDVGSDAYNDCIAETTCKNAGLQVGSTAFHECILNWLKKNE
jgi:hypothetical protein